MLLQMLAEEGQACAYATTTSRRWALGAMRSWHCHAWTEGCSRAISSTHSLSTFSGLLGAGRTYTTLGCKTGPSEEDAICCCL